MSNNNLSETTATSSAVGISGLAAAIGFCCIGPWAVTLFGVSGAIFLSRLEPFRPLILAVATLLLAWAFWRAYRPQPACADGACERRQRPLLRLALWFSAGLLLLAYLAPSLQWLVIQQLALGE